jgi:hypothetical protein
MAISEVKIVPQHDYVTFLAISEVKVDAFMESSLALR